MQRESFLDIIFYIHDKWSKRVSSNFEPVPILNHKNQFFHYLCFVTRLLLRQDLLNTWCERRLKRSAMFLSIFRKGNSPSSFYWIPKVTLKWLWKLLVINNFNFLHMNQRSRDYRLWIIVGCKILESSVQHFLSAAFIKNPKSHRQKCSLADVLQNRCS